MPTAGVAFGVGYGTERNNVYDEGINPSICFGFALSEEGRLSALRRGIRASSIEYLYLEYEEGSSLWARAVDLRPEPDGDEFRIWVRLKGSVGFENCRPHPIYESTDGRAEFYAPPDFKVTYESPLDDSWGDPALNFEPLDEWPSIDDLITFEEIHRVHWTMRLDASRSAHEQSVEDWKAWSMSYTDAIATQLNTWRDQLGAEASEFLENLSEWVERAQKCEGNPAQAFVFEHLADLHAKALQQLPDIRSRVDEEKSRQRELTDAAEWINSTGSPRLKKALETGLLHRSMPAYRDERLSIERPGFRWAETGEQLRQIQNPPEEALDLLVKRRVGSPGTELEFAL